MSKISYTIIIILLFVSTPAFAGTIQLPKTGQTTCYDSLGNVISCEDTGQDGELQIGVAWPEPRFTNDNGTTPITGDVVVDQLTGLMWARNANLLNVRVYYWTYALDYVANLNNGHYLGYTDWRLPNINELESLLNAEVPNSATWLNSKGFTNVQSFGYWSSTAHYESMWCCFAWCVEMGTGAEGAIYYDWQSGGWFVNITEYVWPVRGGQCGVDNSAICLPKTGQVGSSCNCCDGALQKGIAWPSPRFIDNADGTVVDKLTGLMWTKDANLPNGTKTWQQALEYVAAMNSSSANYGYTDWRLPNIKEIRSLIDYLEPSDSRNDPHLPQGHPFINFYGLYWSATTCPYHTDCAWAIYSNNCSPLSNKSENGYVWPVRAGQCDPLGDWDNDTVCNDVDNCPNDYNPRQSDCDGDGIGDVCDLDTIDPDGDGIDQACDNCPIIANPDQMDTDSDAAGNVCDNCPMTPNGPGSGTCVKITGGVLMGTGVVCYGLEECNEDELCDMEQLDINDNGIGDACECYADCNHDGKVNTTDLGIMKIEFFRTNCATVPCQADINGDNRVNTSDLGIMKVQFFKTGCPVP